MRPPPRCSITIFDTALSDLPPARGDAEGLRVKLNRETGRIAWRELQRYYAQGRAVAVDPRLDLVEVALRLAQDDVERVARWMRRGEIGPVSDPQARVWYQREALLWAVVVSPWVLVQERVSGNTDEL